MKHAQKTWFNFYTLYNLNLRYAKYSQFFVQQANNKWNNMVENSDDFEHF